jgi:hypothetical protein
MLFDDKFEPQVNQIGGVMIERMLAIFDDQPSSLFNPFTLNICSHGSRLV